MFKRILLLLIVITGQSSAMENVRIKRIKTPKDLNNGLMIVFNMFDTVYKQVKLNNDEKEFIDEYRKNRLDQLLSIKNRDDIFVKKGQEIIGFLASHQDEEDLSRIILDNIFPGIKKNINQVTNIMLTHLHVNHPEATEVWTAVLKKKKNPIDKLLKHQGFKESEYMDKLHDKERFQGWQRPLEK